MIIDPLMKPILSDMIDKIESGKIKIIKFNIFQRIRLCWKILRTKGYTEDYTIKELSEDNF